MAEIRKINGRPVIDYMARDYDSLLRSMRGMIPYKMPEWFDYQSEADFGNVLLEMFAHMGDVVSYYQDRMVNESFLATANERRSIIHHLRLIGYRLSTAWPASAFLDIYVDKEVEGTAVITPGAAFATKSTEDGSSIRFEYTGDKDILIDFSQVEIKDEKRTVTISVEEGRTVSGEVIGQSDGTPNQQFTLVHSPLILSTTGLGVVSADDITLVVERVSGSGTVKEYWQLRESLAFSREDATDFIIEVDENDRATVIFGDGNFGKIPPSGAFIRVSYRVGGGSFGNVAAGFIDTVLEAPDLALLGAEVNNPLRAVGGADRESIEHAVTQAPALFRTQGRAVTSEDYKTLALDFVGVGKARPEKGDWNTVILYIAPEGGGLVNDVLKKNLIVYFDDKSPMGTDIEIHDVDYVRIYLTAKVGINSYYADSPEEVGQRVQAVVAELLAFENVDFAQTLYISKFYESIEAVEGVGYVTITEFRREDSVTADHLGTGEILLGVKEVPVIPNETGDEEYSSGLKIEIQ